MSNTGPTQRQLRVGEQIRHIVAETMSRGHFRDPALIDSGGVTVTEVRISPDLKYATAYVMSLGGADMEKVLPALNNESHAFQKEIARQGKMRFTPRIKFIADGSFDEAQRIEDILRDLPKAAD